MWRFSTNLIRFFGYPTPCQHNADCLVWTVKHSLEHMAMWWVIINIQLLSLYINSFKGDTLSIKSASLMLFYVLCQCQMRRRVILIHYVIFMNIQWKKNFIHFAYFVKWISCLLEYTFHWYRAFIMCMKRVWWFWREAVLEVLEGNDLHEFWNYLNIYLGLILSRCEYTCG